MTVTPSASTGQAYQAAVMRRAQDVTEIQGEAAVDLIEATSAVAHSSDRSVGSLVNELA